MAIPLTALGGVPIIPVPGQSSGGNDARRTLIDLERLLDRLEAQLHEDSLTKFHESDPWRTAGLAIALTHANTTLLNVNADRGLTKAEASTLRARLQAATERYVKMYPLQAETRGKAAKGGSMTSHEAINAFDTREYMLQGLMDDSDSDSEFGQEQETQQMMSGNQDKEERALGGIAPEEKIAEKEDESFDEYEAATTSLRRRIGENVKGSSEKMADDDGAGTNGAPPTALQSERSVQDSLSSELLRMAGILKTNSIKFADALERDRKILEEADEKLQGNLSLMTRTSGKLGEYSRKARSMGWLTLGAVAMVCISWVVMFVLIRLT